MYQRMWNRLQAVFRFHNVLLLARRKWRVTPLETQDAKASERNKEPAGPLRDTLGERIKG